MMHQQETSEKSGVFLYSIFWGCVLLTEPEILMEIRERLVRVETKLDAQNRLQERVDTVEDKVIETEARSKSNTHRIDKLEGNNTWLWRTIAGAIITAGAGAIAIFK